MAVQVTAIKKEGKRPWEINVSDGKLLKTFDADVVSGLAVGMWIEPVTELSSNKYHDTMLNEWKAADPPAGLSPLAPIVLERGAVSSEVWEARDRRIAMESAYGSAAVFYGGIGVKFDKDGNQLGASALDLARLARAIFRDIIAAGNGETFEPKKEPTRDEH